MATKDQLSAHQQAFVDEYVRMVLNEKSWNATEAAERVYNCKNRNSASQIGFGNLRIPKIKKAIDRRLIETKMGEDEILKRLADMGRVDVDWFMTVLPDGTPVFDYEKAQQAGVTHLIKKFEIVRKNDEESGDVKTYFVKVEFHDSLQALKELARINDMINTRLTTFNFDVSNLPTPALEALAAGEDPMDVLYGIAIGTYADSEE